MNNTPIKPESIRRIVLSLLLFLALSPSAATVCSAQVIDLRSGVQTTFYGGYNPSQGTGDFYGWTMAFGDVDGDGYVDFLASSANAEGPNDVHDPERDVYLLFGRPRAQIDSLYAVDAPGVADIVFYRGGFAMACADIDNDGYDDMLLGEEGVYVVFGAPRDQLRSSYDFNESTAGYTSPDIRIFGSQSLAGDIGMYNTTLEAVGMALVSGDINGDNYADIIVGDMFGGLRGGATYVVFGGPRPSLPSAIDVTPTSTMRRPDVSIYEESLKSFPISLAVGDLDGDGVDDLVASTIAGEGEEYVASQLGNVYGFWGRPEWEAAYDIQNWDFDFAMYGTPGSLAKIGYRLEAGDLDGDGRDDLIVASPQHHIVGGVTGDRRNMGEYRIFFGRPRAVWPKWSDAIVTTDVFILGADGGEALNLNGPGQWAIAFSIATGDRDGDEYDDLLIGAGHGQRQQPGGLPEYTGRAYLLRGRPRSLWDPFIDLRDSYDTIIYGVDGYTLSGGGGNGRRFDLLGGAVGMADIDSSGVDELFLSAQFGDGPDNMGSDNGEIYVIYDSGTSPALPAFAPPRSALLPNYPNPFNPSTTFRFTAPPGETANLTIYDVLGRRVAEPLAASRTSSAETAVVWDGRNDRGRALPSGVYFAKLRVGNETHSQKIHIVW